MLDMTDKEVIGLLQGMRDGKKLQHSKDKILWYEAGSHTILIDNNCYYRAMDEPKRKVKKWQWIMEHNGEHYISGSFFKNEEEAKNFYESSKVIGKAKWTEFEFEE